MRLLLTAVLSLAVNVVTPGPANADDTNPSSQLVEEMSGTNLVRHLQAFQDIADRNGGNRAAGTPGYDESADYVESQLKSAGYEVISDPFEFMYFKELAPAQLKLTNKYPAGGPAAPPQAISAITIRHSGSGRVTGPVRDASAGCLPTDFAGFEVGAVAKVVRGTCTFQQKISNAVAAGAAAVVVVNDREGDLRGGLELPATVPVVGVRKQDGAMDGQVEVVTSTVSERRVTRNLIVQTPHGRTDEVVMVGAHLDSVTEGPGVNDNGSGSAAVLELALRLARFQPDRAVRLVWWSAEEVGLLGSLHYVSALPQRERENIALYLNFDMIASPNGIYGIFDGDDSDLIGKGPGPLGSEEIERTFEEYFDSRSLPHVGTDFSGRSDYGPFIAVGVPAGGLFTGAEDRKTAEQVAFFGGIADAPLDPCYHQVCDTIKNVDLAALDVNADALAHVVGQYAFHDR
ncbi:amidohydrolase [Acrocarpospora corrugata]|uniref:Amidohydrolase n=1 Tax=Acrocarpospora corrugata TaxID=35763 RepID=A0A5M3W012_9ACTN|nr:M28 family metallopeptidase [Acrocarpospora corrugata]GES02116.1 amidohydrolase [Acrocarpospora corrugata]